jgi:sulfite dehydrogenase (cytochrome) subunit B
MSREAPRARLLILAAFLTAAASSARADEFSLTLKTGPGAEAVANNCAACHSLDYIVLNSPFPTRAAWQAEIAKMINVYGADVPAQDAKTILDYLAKYYGS